MDTNCVLCVFFLNIYIAEDDVKLPKPAFSIMSSGGDSAGLKMKLDFINLEPNHPPAHQDRNVSASILPVE